MRNKSLTVLLVACLLAGCTSYDAIGIPADLALLLFTDVYEDNNGRTKGFDDDHNRLWNFQTSRCVYVDENARGLQGSLEDLFDEVEARGEYVELPTGEKYPVGSVGPRKSYDASSTAACIAKEDD